MRRLLSIAMAVVIMAAFCNNTTEAAMESKYTCKETVVALVLDESGSMDGCKLATISGYNEYVDGLRKQDNTKFGLVAFNSMHITPFSDSVRPVAQAPELDGGKYIPNGSTPLYDAIGQTIKELEKIAGCPKCGPNVMLVIMTDGLENTSTKYSHREIVRMLEEKKEMGWSIAYMGANQDAWAVGTGIGISPGNTFTYTTGDMKGAFGTLSNATVSYVNNPTDANVINNLFNNTSGDIK